MTSTITAPVHAPSGAVPQGLFHGCSSSQEAAARTVEFLRAALPCDAIAAFHDGFLLSRDLDICPFAACTQGGHLHLNTGPALRAVNSGAQVLVHDTAADQRWPRWSAPVAEQGFRSALCLSLAADGRGHGGVTLLRRRPGSFPSSRVEEAARVVGVAARALSTEHTRRRLEAFEESQTHIRVAQGILQMRFRLTRVGAMNRLRALSQSTNTRLPVVARAIIDVRAHHSRELFSQDAEAIARLIRQTIHTQR